MYAWLGIPFILLSDLAMHNATHMGYLQQENSLEIENNFNCCFSSVYLFPYVCVCFGVGRWGGEGKQG